MRMIGRLEEQGSAARFSDYLYAQGIDSEIRQDLDGAWAIWVHAERQVESARELFALYREAPDDPRYDESARAAERRRAEESRSETALQARTFDRHRLWAGPSGPLGRLTLALIAVSVGVAIFSGLGAHRDILHPLLITEFQTGGGYIRWQQGLPEIGQGQVWRLFTPMFIHFGILHLLFNMLWLKDLGGMIERVRGACFLALLVLVISAASNVAQYAVSGPSFGGMSGVVYGLLGFVWMKTKFDRASGLYVHQSTVILMIVWFFLCLTGLLGPVANTAHAVGLAVGVAWGYLSARVLWKRG